MNRFRLIDEVSIYLLDSNNCHITLLYAKLSRSSFIAYPTSLGLSGACEQEGIFTLIANLLL